MALRKRKKSRFLSDIEGAVPAPDELPPPKTKLALKKHIRAIELRLSAEVEKYRDITSDGYLRHSTFKGLAKD